MSSDAVVAQKKPVSGIGGWLLLPMLGLIGSPIVQGVEFVSLGDTLNLLPQLSSAQAVLLVAELVGNFVLALVAPIYLLVLMLQKRRSFPRLFVMLMVANAVFVALDLLLAYLAFKSAYDTGTPFWDRETVRSVVGSVAGLAIWVPYMRASVRVQNTFVN
jgi:hypothetical protein